MEENPVRQASATAVHCRVAVKEDLPEVLGLYAQPTLDNGQVLSLFEAEQIFERLDVYPDYHLHVAVHDGRIVGTYALLIMDNLGHLGASSGVIEAVAVDPGWQGRGIGRLMMRDALARCGERGCYKAVLSSNLARAQAHAFYESLEFERHGYSFKIATPGWASIGESSDERAST